MLKGMVRSYTFTLFMKFKNSLLFMTHLRDRILRRKAQMAKSNGERRKKRKDRLPPEYPIPTIFHPPM
jgi:hypothetical protein